jgi:hypothetical protein
VDEGPKVSTGMEPSIPLSDAVSKSPFADCVEDHCLNKFKTEEQF